MLLEKNGNGFMENFNRNFLCYQTKKPQMPSSGREKREGEEEKRGREGGRRGGGGEKGWKEGVEGESYRI